MYSGMSGAVFLRHGFEVARREDGVGGEVGEILLVDDVADLVAR